MTCKHRARTRFFADRELFIDSRFRAVYNSFTPRLTSAGQPPSPLPECPHCSSTRVRWLEFTSIFNDVDSFQCLSCGHRVDIAAGAPRNRSANLAVERFSLNAQMPM